MTDFTHINGEVPDEWRQGFLDAIQGCPQDAQATISYLDGFRVGVKVFKRKWIDAEPASDGAPDIDFGSDQGTDEELQRSHERQERKVNWRLKAHHRGVWE